MPTRSRTEPSRLESAGSRTEPQWQLTDTQWFLIEDLFPDKAPNPKGGRPWRGNRECFEGILFVLFTGCRWKDLPKHRFPSKSVCHSRFKEWATAGLFTEAWRRLLALKKELGQLNPTRLLGDGTFVPAKKGGAALAQLKLARARRSCCSRTPKVFPWA